MMNNEWLKNLKVGDKVGVFSFYGSSLQTIKQLTEKLIILDNQRFNRESGYLVGQTVIITTYLIKATKKFQRKYIKQQQEYINRIMNRVSRETLSNLNLEELKSIYLILKKYKEI